MSDGAAVGAPRVSLVEASVMPPVVALILAAGQARRFGGDKRWARLPDGRTLLDTVLDTARLAGLPAHVVLRPGDEAGAACCARHGARAVWAPLAARGMGATLAAGLRELTALTSHSDAPAAVLMLADMPWVQPDTVRALCAAFAREPTLVWPWHQGRPGHPRLLPRTHWPALTALDGDEGARGLDWAAATRIDVSDAGVLRDVDVPADLPGQG